jgi:hypothetical protein
VSFRTQTLIGLLTALDRRTNATDEDVDGSNVIKDTFYPVSERLTTSDTVEVAYFTPTTFVWGDGGVTTNANWAWGYGGVWQS